ncbi:MAG: hypothetical protein HFJ30_03855 [Clostridia bacterium]|jgi:hypothetical protein|nr:hypothetical protein [Clostridia bacterium]
MFKMWDKLYEHWEKMRLKNEWSFLIVIGEIVTFMLGSLYIFYMIAPYVEQIPCFLGMKRYDIALYIWLAFWTLCMIIVGAWVWHNLLEEKKTEQRLKNRELPDYVVKYQGYVDFVENALQQEEYQEVHLLDEWVKVFDKYLDMTARLRVKAEQDFTDFDVIACLMYAVTYVSNKDGSIINVPFAFHCAKAFLRIPNVYQCKRIEGYELVLKPIESLKEVSFETIDTSALLEIQELVSVYLSQTKYYSQALELADFLHIFYLRCDK